MSTILCLSCTQGQAPADDYSRIVLPFLNKHCMECHGATDAQSDFRIDKSLPNTFLDASARSHWAEVVNVLNSHEMPPETHPQPTVDEVSQVVDWITEQTRQAELVLRENAVVMRRLNRSEYKNTVRDLVGVDIDISGFPQDPPASGFDNIGSSLSLSPMQLELYLDTARQIIDAAFVDGTQPEKIKWRFEIDSGDSDSNRVRIDGQNPIVNGGNNPVLDGFKKLHHDSWDKTLNVRDFKMKQPGKYVLRFRAAGKVPGRKEVVESARAILEHRFKQQMADNPKGEKWHREQSENDLRHFENDWMYRYGPPRMKVVLTLGGQPRTVAEFDVPATLDAPQIYEVPVVFSGQSAGVTVEYAYSIPSVLENFWLQRTDSFARPELYVDWFEIEGPIYESWPPESQKRLMPETLTEANEKELAERTIGRFCRQAFRRPVSKAEVAPYLEMYYAARKRGDAPVPALKSTLVGVLVSPNFLYLVEAVPKDSAIVSASQTSGNVATKPEAEREIRITQHQLANRLSYFLWSSQPDRDLMKVADASQLSTPNVLREQVTRMLDDPKSEALVRNFSDQWLGLREVGANPPAADLYPHYDRHLETSMIEESRSLFRTILREQRNVLDFVDPDYVVINERLARFYQIEGVTGDQFRVVPVAKSSNRGGVLTTASTLCITSNGTRTSPVKRGTWVLKNVLGIDPGLPVANAGDIAPKVPGIDRATVRQRLEIHRELPQCARCHNKIDPLGLALENYNATGEFREREGFGYKGRIQQDDPVINAKSKLPDGTEIDGPAELKRTLREREDLFLSCLTRKMMTYAIGRELTLADEPAVKDVVRIVKEKQYRLDALIMAIVESNAFQQY